MWQGENPRANEGERAPWSAPGLASVAVNVLTGLSSTPHPPLATKALSDALVEGVKEIFGHARKRSSGLNRGLSDCRMAIVRLALGNRPARFWQSSGTFLGIVRLPWSLPGVQDVVAGNSDKGCHRAGRGLHVDRRLDGLCRCCRLGYVIGKSVKAAMGTRPGSLITSAGAAA